jgi:hypothetical protein
MNSRIEKAIEKPIEMMVKSKKITGKITDCPLRFFIYVNPDENEKDFTYALPALMEPRESVTLGLTVGRIIIEKNLRPLKREMLIKSICKKINKQVDFTFKFKSVKPFDPIACIVISEVYMKSIPNETDEYKNYKHGDLAKDPTSVECFQIMYKEIDKPVRGKSLPFVVKDNEVIFIDDEIYKVEDAKMTDGIMPHLIENLSNLGSILDRIKNEPLS